MGEIELVRLIAGQGAAGVLAYLIVRWYREDAKERLARELQRLESERADKLMIVGVLQENTRTLGELHAVIDRALRERVTP